MTVAFPERPLLAYLGAGTSLVCHLLSFTLYICRYDTGPAFTPVDVQVMLLGTALLIGVTASLFVKTRVQFRAILVLRLGIYFALCYAYRSWYEIRILLLLGTCFETGLYEPFPANLFLVSGCIITSFIVLELIAMIFAGWSAATLSHAVLLVLVPAVAGISSCFITLFREHMLEQRALVSRLNQTVSQLSRSNVLLQDAAFHAAEQSRSSERHRVAREIHDTVGYTMTNLIMMMEAATDLVFDNPEELQRIMQAARDQAKSGLEETRRSLRELREYEEPQLKGIQAIQKLISTYDTVSWVTVDVEYGNSPMTFGDEIDSAIFHFVQEGLTNALRHGKATRIKVSFWIQNDKLRVLIRDNGRGVGKINEGIGLAGMRERVERLGGGIEAGNTADGFQVTLTVPFHRAARERQ